MAFWVVYLIWGCRCLYFVCLTFVGLLVFVDFGGIVCCFGLVTCFFIGSFYWS